MSSPKPSTMPVCIGLTLPEEIVIWEILVRLPPKPLVRCRAVCYSWRRLTSSGDFLLAHHHQQPSLPLVCGFDHEITFTGYLDMLARATAAAPELQPVSGIQCSCGFNVEAFCGSLLILSLYRQYLYVCNPSTFQVAHLGPFNAFSFLGFYAHKPTGEYRLLLFSRATPGEDVYFRGQVIGPAGAYYVLSLDDNLPRCTGVYRRHGSALCTIGTPVLLHGCLHWGPQRHHGCAITVFDTVEETFRSMRGPAVPEKPYHPYCKDDNLFLLGGTLGVYSCTDDEPSIDIWVLQDYEAEAWEFRCRIELPVAQIKKQVDGFFSFLRFDGSC